jgi:hypothetical protein
MLTNLATQYGTVFISIGLILITLSLQVFEGWRVLVSMLAGMASIVVGCFAFIYAVKMAKKEQELENAKYAKLLRAISRRR